MAEQKKGWGSTVVGWFVEFDEKGAGKAAPAGKAPPAGAARGGGAQDATDDIIRRYAGGGRGPKAGAKAAAEAAAKPDTSPARSPSGEVPPDFGGGAATSPASSGAASAAGHVPAPGKGGTIDFQDVFRKAGITDQEADQVNRALSLLTQLPEETPQPVKKQIVEASLNTFGVKIETIIESAVAEIEALHGCIQAGSDATEKLLAESEERIAALTQQISDVRQVMDARKAEQSALETQARAHGLQVQRILEFFGQELVGKVVKESPRLHEPGKS